MSTAFDWISIALFSGLALLFLGRSARPEGPPDRVLHYLPAALGCALGNQLGNHGYFVAGALTLILVAGYILHVLKPRLQ